MLKINKITPAIGAEITGLDFTKPLSVDLTDAIYQVLMENLVLVFPKSVITPEAHLTFAQTFGQLDEPHLLYPYVDGFKNIVKLENDSASPPDTNSWHTDLTFKKQQPFASILVGRSIPKVGGDTMWSSCYAAYDRLSEGMKQDLDGLEAMHDMGDFRNTFAIPQGDTSGEARLNDAVGRFGHKLRPIVGIHPVTGRKFLNFNEAFVTHIIGLTTNDANALKTFLANHMNTPEDQMRWRWSEGDIVMWDNRVTMHYAVLTS